MTGSVSFYTKYLNMAMPEFNINTWHDFMYDAFKVLDASIGNLYSVENFKGSWKNSTIYYVGDKLINSEDFLIYEVLIEHTTDGTSTVSDFITNNPTYYKVYDSVTLSRAWAINETLVNNEDYSSKMYAIGTIEQNPNGSSKYYMEETNSLKVDVQGLKDSVDSTKLLIDDIYTNVTSLKDETLGYRNESETFATNSENSSVNSENSSINSNTYANNSLNYMNQTLTYRNEAEVFRDEAEQATIGKANVDLDNLSETGQAVIDGKANTNLMNTNFITNAILSAPNGVATYSGLQLQLPAETVLACPNGINADGTRKSIVVTTDSLLTITPTAADGVPYKLFYRQYDNAIDVRRTDTTFYYEQPTTPTGMSNRAVWYNNSPSINKCYYYNGSAWAEYPFVVLADFSYTGGAISDFNAKYPINLITYADTNFIARQGKPSNKYLDLTLGASGSNYEVKYTGIISLKKSSNAADQFIYIQNDTAGGFRDYSTAPTSGTVLTADIPVTVGDIVIIAYSAGGSTVSFRNIADKGVFNV